jgi:bacteriorhodopsin
MERLFTRNDALETNPPSGNQYLTTNGSNWLFTVTTLFGFSLVRPFHPLLKPLPDTH